MTNESVWKAQGKTRPGIEDSIAVGTAQIAKTLEPHLVLKTTDHLYKALAVH
ncbi:hypothetical protein CC2G_009787 [Coprinopsis cinerea AmutBmut pab1-1]|nr:hypothetical protein CC2G_009787 [Coprinopsis cinerea AmutBmut pab1-1]